MNEPAPSTVNVATTDVLIIGAGPTGLTLACDLARRGVSFLLLERSTTPSTASRAKTIQPRTMEVADNLGVAGRVLTEGRVNVPTRHYDRARVVSEAVELAAGVRTTDAPYPPVWLSQPRFEQILRDHLTELGGTVHWGSEVTDLQQDGDGVTATVTTRPDAGSRTVHARYAVGVDGGRSTVRALAGIELHGTSLTDQRWHLGDVRVTGLSRHCQHLWTSKEDGLLSLFPLPGTDLWQFQASIPADPAEPEEPSLELFRRIFAERAGCPRRGHPGRRLALPLPDQRAPRRPLPQRADPLGGRRRPHPLPGRRPGHEHRHPGRLQPRLETRRPPRWRRPRPA